MRDNEFAIGDVVRLKSGGPPLTVEELTNQRGYGELEAVCVWLLASGFGRARLSVALLEQVQAGSPELVKPPAKTLAPASLAGGASHASDRPLDQANNADGKPVVPNLPRPLDPDRQCTRCGGRSYYDKLMCLNGKQVFMRCECTSADAPGASRALAAAHERAARAALLALIRVSVRHGVGLPPLSVQETILLSRLVGDAPG